MAQIVFCLCSIGMRAGIGSSKNGYSIFKALDELLEVSHGHVSLVLSVYSTLSGACSRSIDSPARLTALGSLSSV